MYKTVTWKTNRFEGSWGLLCSCFAFTQLGWEANNPRLASSNLTSHKSSCRFIRAAVRESDWATSLEPQKQDIPSFYKKENYVRTIRVPSLLPEIRGVQGDAIFWQDLCIQHRHMSVSRPTLDILQRQFQQRSRSDRAQSLCLRDNCYKSMGSRDK